MHVVPRLEVDLPEQTETAHKAPVWWPQRQSQSGVLKISFLKKMRSIKFWGACMFDEMEGGRKILKGGRRRRRGAGTSTAAAAPASVVGGE